MSSDETDALVAAEIRPCRHMARWVDALADGSLHGIVRWYAQLHVKSCRQCRSTLHSIRRVKEQLQALRHRDHMTTSASSNQLSLTARFDEVEKGFLSKSNPTIG